MEKFKNFPLFLNIEGRKAVVVGGGKIALRRIKTLLKFELQITVVSPKVEEEILSLANEGSLVWVPEAYESRHLQGAFLVLAATNVRQVNHQIGKDARNISAFVSVADCKEECTFFFPAVLEDERVIIAVAGDGTDHKAVAKKVHQVREGLQAQGKEC